MTLHGVRNVEWLVNNASRAYPLVPTASGVSTDEMFRLPQSTLLSMRLSVPWQTTIDPSRLFISRIESLSDSLKLHISYDGAGSVESVGLFNLARNTRQDIVQAELQPASAWAATTGHIIAAINNPSSDTPHGDFTFAVDSTRLEVDVVRPSTQTFPAFTVQGESDQSAYGRLRFTPGDNTQTRLELRDGEYHLYIDALNSDAIDAGCECGDAITEPIRTINQIPADDNGHFTFSGIKCFEVSTGVASLNLNNPCSDPCCGCEEATALAAALIPFGPQVATLVGFSNRFGLQLSQMGFLFQVEDVGEPCDVNEFTEGELPTTTTAAPTTTTEPTTTAEPTTTTAGPGIPEPVAYSAAKMPLSVNSATDLFEFKLDGTNAEYSDSDLSRSIQSIAYRSGYDDWIVLVHEIEGEPPVSTYCLYHATRGTAGVLDLVRLNYTESSDVYYKVVWVPDSNQVLMMSLQQITRVAIGYDMVFNVPTSASGMMPDAGRNFVDMAVSNDGAHLLTLANGQTEGTGGTLVKVQLTSPSESTAVAYRYFTNNADLYGVGQPKFIAGTDTDRFVVGEVDPARVGVAGDVPQMVVFDPVLPGGRTIVPQRMSALASFKMSDGDFIFVGDRSGSLEVPGAKNAVYRWNWELTEKLLIEDDVREPLFDPLDISGDRIYATVLPGNS